MLEAAAGRRVVMAGSDKELGVADGAPGSPYAASKVAATAYGRMFHRAYGASVVNLRVFMVYGGGPQDEAKLVPHTIASLLAGEAPALTAGSRQFDWVYVDDVVDAFVAAGTAPAGDDGEAIDVGSGRLTSIRELVEEIGRAVGTGVRPASERFRSGRRSPGSRQT